MSGPKKSKRDKQANRKLWRDAIRELRAVGFFDDYPPKGGRQMTEYSRQLPYHYQPSTTAAPRDSMTWELPREDKAPVAKACTTCHRCNHCGAHHEGFVEQPVLISGEVYGKIRALMNHFTTHEWGGYFLADEDGRFVELVIPKQEGMPATWKAEPGEGEGLAIAGVIHSHVRMGVFHSGTDDDNLVANHPVSVVVSKTSSGTMEFEAIRTIRMPEPCGGLFRYKTSVLLSVPGAEEWVEEVKDRVRLGSPFLRESTTTTTPSSGTATYRLCQRTKWCYRDYNHAGHCSQHRESSLCRKTSWCVLKDEHDGKCETDGAPKRGESPAGAREHDTLPARSTWTPYIGS